MEADISLSISSWEPKIIDRLLLLLAVMFEVVVAVVAVLVLVVVGAGLYVVLELPLLSW